MAAADLLAECEAAISACMKSQEYQIADRQQRRAMLKDLLDTHKYFSGLVQESSGCGMSSLGTLDPPSG